MSRILLGQNYLSKLVPYSPGAAINIEEVAI
jgi:hypothetical protein